MKRIILLAIAALTAALGSACEKWPASNLPEHYKHKLHDHGGEKH